MVDLLNACMKDEMRRDEKILVFGEDVADVSREQYLGKVKGKGGVFKVTWGLQKEFGGARVYNSPLAEANIVGRAIGLALRGFKPVVEIQFFDYIWPAYMQLRDELATMRWRSNNDVRCAGRRARDVRRLHPRRDLSLADGRVAVHALPGPARRVSGDGARRERTAAHGDPLRRSGDLPRAQASLPPDVQQGRAIPGPNFMIPFGKAKVVREGTDVTVVTYGATVQRALAAANQVAETGRRRRGDRPAHAVAVGPGDGVRESVKKTNRVIVALRGFALVGLRRGDRGARSPTSASRGSTRR